MKKVKFAVVREDPDIEALIIKKFNCRNALLIASGGCVALSLKNMFDNLDITLFDLNTNQIDLIKSKVSKLKIADKDLTNSVFNIGSDSCKSLNGCGEFESLFRGFRNFIFEFIASEEKVKTIFLGTELLAKEIIDEIVANKYWPVAFDLYFSNSLLIAMFGQDAIQHAEPNSYPSYFKNVLENGLIRPGFQNNYFLQHIFLGYYLDNKESLPYYLAFSGSDYSFNYINDNLLNIKGIEKYDLISLSNIFDWTDEEQTIYCLRYLSENMKKGAHIIFRQLNNSKDYTSSLTKFMANKDLERELLVRDRSLFYNKINILQKVD